MKTIRLVALLIVLAAGFAAIAASAQQRSPFAGIWDVHIDHPKTNRVVDEQWIIEVQGTYATGKVVVRSKREFPIEGDIDGNAIKWKVATSLPRDPYHWFIGTLNGDEIKGDIEWHDHSDDGTFVAKRARS